MTNQAAALGENGAQQLDEQTALQDIARIAASAENLQTIFDVIVEKAAQLTGADATVLSFLSSDRQTLNDVATFGVAVQMKRRRDRPSHKGLSGTVIRSGAPILVNDLINHGSASPDEVQGLNVGVAMIVPLTVAGQITGILSAFNQLPRRPFPRHKFDLLNTFAAQAAQSIEDARQHTETVKRLRALGSLEEISKVLVSNQARDELLKLVVDQVARFLQTDRVTIDLVDPDGASRSHAACFGMDAEVRQGQKHSLDEGILGHIIRASESLLVDDISIHPLASPRARTRGARHGVFAPLCAEGRVIGAIEAIRSADKLPFTKNDLHLLTLFADQAAVAIENAGLHDELTQRMRELELVQNLGSALVGELNLERVRELVVEKAIQLTGAETSALCIPNENENTRVYVAVYGLDAETLKGKTLSLSEGLHGIVYATGKPILSADLIEDERASIFGRESMNRSVAIAPLKSHLDFIGWLSIWSRSQVARFNENHLRILSIFANQAAIALENARLFEETRQRTQRLDVLYRISTSLASIQGARESCQTVVRAGREILGYPFLGIFLIDPENGDRVLQAQSGWDHAPEYWRLHPGEGLSDTAVRTGKLQYYPDVTLDPRYVRGAGESRSEVDVPIKIGDSVLGVLIVEGRRVNAFSADDLDVLQAVASQLAVALENARLFAAAQQELAERKRTETELQAQRDFALQVMNTMGQGLVVTDADDHFEYVNPAFARMLGYAPEELIGKTTTEITFPEDLAILESANARRAAGEGGIYEMRLKRADGSSFYALITGVPRWRERTDMAAIVVVSNLTERKLMEQALARARDQALEASRLKSEFLATMSHEIRTPMNSIIGMAEMLLGAGLEHQPREFAEIIHQSANSLLVIINDILDFSKIEAGKFVLDTQDFELPTVVESAVEMLAIKAREKNLGLMSFVSPDIPRNVRGDAGRLRQILLNLLGNAVKFTAQGEVIVRVNVIAQTKHDVTVQFSVSDTGIGISDAARARLFQPFTQADGSMTRRYGGTGLGLAISKRLIELMNGEISVESVEGKGSTFWFTARLERATEPSPRQADPRGLRVLVVDDIKTHRDIVTTYLSAWGMCAHGESNARDALKQLRDAAAREPYDLAIVDWRMPDMDGRELARAIKQDPALAATRLILLTGFDERGSGAESVNAGFDAYLTKPVRQSYLFDAIARVIAGDHQEPMKPAEKSPAAPVQMPASGKHILLAEDNLINQKVALLQLGKLGYSAHTVANGREAVAFALNNADSFALVLMDCQMPEMDGFDATRAIRKAELLSGHHIPIIAMTANAMEGDRDRCIAAGMDDYISKPVNLDNLNTMLQRWSLPEKEQSYE